MGKKTAAVSQYVSPQELYLVVCGAASQNPAEMQAASTRLKEMLDMSGTYDALHEIAAEKSVALPVRQLAMIQFKNAAMNHWRSARLFSADEKSKIRVRSFAFLDEEDDTIAACNEVVVARIARLDFPQHWPFLVTDLMGHINNSLKSHSASTLDPRTSRILHRSLRVLNSVLKELSKVKMAPGVKTMRELAENLYLVLSTRYASIASGLTSLSAESMSSMRTAENLLLAHLLFKSLMKISVWLWNKIQTEPYRQFQPWFLEFFQSTAVHLRSMVELRINIMTSIRSSNVQLGPVSSRSADLYNKYIMTIGKFLRRLQVIDIGRFVALPMCDELVSYYWDKVVQANATPDLIADSPHAVFPLRFLVQCMMLFKESLAQWSPTRKRATATDTTMPQEFVERAVTLLVTSFMPLKPADLEGWMADPEEWVHAEEQEDAQWEFEIRPCAERVLLTLANQYSQYVSPLLAEAFNKLNGQPVVDLQGIIQKEAIYTAVGRCAHRLNGKIDFSAWLDIATVEVNNPSTDFLILKRRVAWLIGKWVGDMCSNPNDTRIWQILLRLLSEKETGAEVVRLTVATAIRECVDSLDFNADVFVPFMGPVMKELLALIGDAESTESKRKVANCLNTIIDRAETRIVPLIPMITEPLPQLWASAGDEWLMKGTLLSTVSSLVTSAKDQSVSLAVIVVPLVRESLASGASTHLDEDALGLWSAALRNTPTMARTDGASLIDLFPIAISLLGENLDLLGKVIGIVESYFLLDAVQVVEAHSHDLFPAFLRAMGQALSANVTDILIALDLLFQLAPPSTYAETLHASGLFTSLMKTIGDDEADTIQLTHHIFIFARIALADRNIFLQLMTVTATVHAMPEGQLWEGLLDQWWRRFDNMSEPRHRKLAAMGIASLLSTGRPEVLNRLSSEIFNLWLDVFSELKEVMERQGDPLDDENTKLKAWWDRPSDAFFNETEGTLEYDRRKLTWDNDPVRTTALSSFLAVKLQEAEAACGGSQVMQTQYLSKADPTVLKQVMAEVFGK